MKTVAVSQRVDVYPERGERRDALDQRLITFLLVLGYVPVPVPNGLYIATLERHLDHTPLDAWLERLSPQAIVLSGGNSIGECLARDLTEGRLLDHARAHRLPVLGICRGMQMMATWAGAALHRVDGHTGTRHRLAGKVTAEVNSYHDFALADCPVDFEVLAHSEDGVIEAIRHRDLPWEGWMWHPEREALYTSKDRERLRALFA